MVIAVRQVLDYTDTFKAVIVVLIGFVVYLVFWVTMGSCRSAPRWSEVMFGALSRAAGRKSPIVAVHELDSPAELPPASGVLIGGGRSHSDAAQWRARARAHDRHLPLQPRRPRSVTPVAVLLSLVLQAAPTADAVDPALRAAVERFFELQEKEDAAGYLALWSPSGTPPRPEQLKYVFDNGDDKYSDLVISRVSINGDRARVRINVRRERSSTRKPDGTPFVSAYPMSIALTYEKTGGDWKLLSEGPAADDLAASLLEAPDDAAREALLASEPTSPASR